MTIDKRAARREGETIDGGPWRGEDDWQFSIRYHRAVTSFFKSTNVKSNKASTLNDKHIVKVDAVLW